MSTLSKAAQQRAAHRKRDFEAVLRLAGETASAWAQSRGITKAHLSLTLAGKRESKALTDQIDQYIDDARSCFQRQRQVAA